MVSTFGFCYTTAAAVFTECSGRRRRRRGAINTNPIGEEEEEIASRILSPSRVADGEATEEVKDGLLAC